MNTTKSVKLSTDNADTSGILSQNIVSTSDVDASVKDKRPSDSDDHRTMDDESILKISFKNAAAYAELNSLIAKSATNVLFYSKRSVICTEDSSKLTLTFNETSNSDNGLFIVDAIPAAVPEIESIVPQYSYNDAIVQIDNPSAENSVQRADESVAAKKENRKRRCDCMKSNDSNDSGERDPKRAKKSNNQRYHNDVEQKFGNFLPGKMSKELRKAMGLADNELPLYIYRMRMLGYPPGWLEHAKVRASGLNLFDSQVSCASLCGHKFIFRL